MIETGTQISLITSVAPLYITTHTRAIDSTDRIANLALASVETAKSVAISAIYTYVWRPTRTTIADSTADARGTQHSLIYSTAASSIIQRIAMQTGGTYSNKLTGRAVLHFTCEQKNHLI